MSDLPKSVKGVDRWDHFSIRVSTPEGMATIVIVENNPGEVVNIFYNIGKAGSSIHAYAFTLAQLALVNIQKRGLVMAIEELSNITTDRHPHDVSGLHARSGPEALSIALIEYKRTIPGLQDDTIARGYRPPTLGPRDERYGV